MIIYLYIFLFYSEIMTPSLMNILKDNTLTGDNYVTWIQSQIALPFANGDYQHPPLLPYTCWDHRRPGVSPLILPN